MSDPKAHRISRELDGEQLARLERQRQQVAAELPELVSRDRMRKEASDEPTLSGELRKAIHASAISIIQLAADAQITPLMLDEFLTGERTLRSDVLDRLASRLGLQLQLLKRVS